MESKEKIGLNNNDLTKTQKRKQSIHYIILSLSAGIIQFSSTLILNDVLHIDKFTRLDEWLGSSFGLSYFIGLVLSVVWNFTLNRKFNFKSANNVPIAMLKVFAYYCVFTPLSVWWYIGLTNLGLSWVLVQVLTMAVNFLTELPFYKFIVFKNSMFSNEIGQKELENVKK